MRDPGAPSEPNDEAGNPPRQSSTQVAPYERVLADIHEVVESRLALAVALENTAAALRASAHAAQVAARLIAESAAANGPPDAQVGD